VILGVPESAFGRTSVIEKPNYERSLVSSDFEATLSAHALQLSDGVHTMLGVRSDSEEIDDVGEYFARKECHVGFSDG
jgi:hypothetical protein